VEYSAATILKTNKIINTIVSCTPTVGVVVNILKIPNAGIFNKIAASNIEPAVVASVWACSNQ
jgi:hypothetical protein